MPPEQEDEEVRAQQQHMMSGVMAMEGQSSAAVKLGGGKVARESNTGSTILAKKQSTFLKFSKSQEGSCPCLCCTGIFPVMSSSPCFTEKSKFSIGLVGPYLGQRKIPKGPVF